MKQIDRDKALKVFFAFVSVCFISMFHLQFISKQNWKLDVFWIIIGCIIVFFLLIILLLNCDEKV